MISHDHNPFGGNVISRFGRFFLSFFSKKAKNPIHWDTETAYCNQCGSLLKFPEGVERSNWLFPLICFPLMMIIQKWIILQNMSQIITILLGAMTLIIVLVLESAIRIALIMSVGKWTVIATEGKNVEELLIGLQNEVALNRKRFFVSGKGIVFLLWMIICYFISQHLILINNFIL